MKGRILNPRASREPQTAELTQELYISTCRDFSGKKADDLPFKMMENLNLTSKTAHAGLGRAQNEPVRDARELSTAHAVHLHDTTIKRI